MQLYLGQLNCNTAVKIRLACYSRKNLQPYVIMQLRFSILLQNCAECRCDCLGLHGKFIVYRSRFTCFERFSSLQIETGRSFGLQVASYCKSEVIN
jgi:hypothetical protein